MNPQLRREVRFEPGYDHREEDKDKPQGQQRGVHGMGIRFLLHGQEGSVQFLLWTDWLPTWCEDGAWGLRFKPDHNAALLNYYPMAVDVGYHSRTPKYEGQSTMPCDAIVGQDSCYYDGSTMMAESVMVLLLQKGHEAVFEYLESYYNSVFFGEDE